MVIKMKRTQEWGQSVLGPKPGTIRQQRQRSIEESEVPQPSQFRRSISSSSSFETIESPSCIPHASLKSSGDDNISNAMDMRSVYPHTHNRNHIDPVSVRLGLGGRGGPSAAPASSILMAPNDSHHAISIIDSYAGATRGEEEEVIPNSETALDDTKLRNRDRSASCSCSTSSWEVFDDILSQNPFGTLRNSVSLSADENFSSSPFPQLPDSIRHDSKCNDRPSHSAMSATISPSKETSSPLLLNAQHLYADKHASILPGHIKPQSTSFKVNSESIPNANQIDRTQIWDYPCESGPHSSPAYLEAHSTSSSSAPESQSNDEPFSAKSSFLKFQSRFLNPKKPNLAATSSSPETLHYSQPDISSGLAKSGLRQQKSTNDLDSLREACEHKLERDNVKTKMMSVWNNIRYGWTFKGKPSLKLDTPLFLLGESYHKRSEDDDYAESEFMKDFTSRIWFTYRSNFYPIPGSKLKTDCGWGCMLRSGQMLVAQCLVNHFLGRAWRMYDQQTNTQLAFYREIIRWFSDPVDSPSDHVPFSLHRLVQFGRNYSKSPGEWYGPASVAFILRDALNRASITMPVLRQLCVYVAQDCTVYVDDVQKLCCSRGKSDSYGDSSDHGNTNTPSRSQESNDNTDSWQRSLILLIPVRLGGEVMNEIYTPCIQRLLSYSQCMGIIGGKPRHSLYFIGYQEDKMIYLDPHFCRDAVDTKASNFPIETYHCMSPRKLSFSRMDPSCTIGFYIKDAKEFQQFTHEVQEYISPPRQRGSYPLFIFSHGSHEEATRINDMTGVERGRVRVRHYRLDENGRRQADAMHESEEFVML